MIVEFTEAARSEYQKLLSGYDSIDYAYGDEFIDSVKERIDNIRRFPLGYPKVYRHIRKCNLGKFPYKMIYQIVNGQVWILAFSHHKRRPLWWKNRILKQK